MVEDLFCGWRCNYILFCCGLKNKHVPEVKLELKMSKAYICRVSDNFIFLMTSSNNFFAEAKLYVRAFLRGRLISKKDCWLSR